MARLRVASLQYFIRPIQTLDQFRDQVVGLVETAADYDCAAGRLPGVSHAAAADARRRAAAAAASRSAGWRRRRASSSICCTELAARHNIYIVAGTIPR